MNFYNYMVRNHKGTGTPERDLANVMRADREHFPRNRNVKLAAWGRLVREHLTDHPDRYTAAHLKTFDACWEEYVQREKSKSNRKLQGGPGCKSSSSMK